MAGEDFGKLSPDQLQQLSKVISEAKKLTNQQAKIIEKVLTGEIEIGEKRIAYLEQYFDIYSKGLDKVARKYSSINDAFLILNNNLEDNIEDLASDVEGISRLAQSTANASGSGSNSGPKPAGSSTESAGGLNKEAVVALRELVSALRVSSSATEEYAASRISLSHFGGGMPPASGGSATPPPTPVGPTIDTVEPAERLKLDELDLETLAEAYSNTINNLIKQQEKKEEILAFSRQENENRVTEQRLLNLGKVTDAEIKAQNMLNELRAQLMLGLNEGDDAGRQRVQLEEAMTRAKIIEDLKLEMANKRARLEYEKMKEVGRALNAEEYANIEKEVAREYQIKLDNIQGLVTAQTKLEALKRANPKVAEALEAKKAQYIADLEYKARLKNNGKLTEEERKHIQELADEKFEADLENLEKIEDEQWKALQEDRRKSIAETDASIAHAVSFDNFTKEDNFLSRMKSLSAMTDGLEGEDKSKAQLAVAVKALSSIVKNLENTIDKIGTYKGGIDTRLQGSNNTQYKGSYWDQLTKDMMSVGAVTPFFKQEDFANNIKSLVESGIAFDLKQRAFLMTIQEKIANTFNVADGTLLRLIRIQQEDTTAGRLGMESALNSFLNNMYENTEYLKGVAESVRGSLEEMEALLDGVAATEVEYEVQKWMGSLYSVGMSQSAVNAISTALGQIASGQIDALTNGSGAGNLLVMAANNSGKSISEILQDGLNADETNKLLQATVNYLAQIAESTDNNVVQQQLASVFGIKASDLKAAVNLASSKDSGKSSIDDIFNETKKYDNMLVQLEKMASTMYKRTSIGEMMSNVWENGQYTLASSMAGSPIAYLTYKMASLLEDATGGISLPFLNVMGFGVDLETTVADLMRVASLSVGIMSSIGPMISGLGNSFSGQAMLNKMGISSSSGLAVTPRGGAGAVNQLDGGGGEQTTSDGGYVGGGGTDIEKNELQKAEDKKEKQLIEAQEEAGTNQVDMLNTYVLKMYEILDAVSSGEKSFTVKVAGYGLTGTSLNNGSQGGVNGLANLVDTSSGGFSESGNSLDTKNVVDLGGWST